MSKPAGVSYQFGSYQLNAPQRILLRDGQPVPLAPKIFDTLLVLLENSGLLVDKEELMSRLWPDTFVEEGTLARNISDLRKVLGDGPGNRYIETVPKRGYRFIAEVRPLSDGTLIVERHIRSRLVVEEQFEDDGGIPSIAVLPFRPITSGGRDEFLELGIADALITRLSNISQIVVRPTSSVRKYLGADLESVQAGRDLKVDNVLDGSIQKSGGRIRVTAQLVSVEDGRSLWAGKFDERFTDIFGVEDAISEQVASALVLKLTGEEKRLIARHYTENVEAHRLYLKGRYYWNKRTRDGYEKGIEYFEQAIEIDPSYAVAYSGLADCYSMLGRFGLVRPSEIMEKAESSAATSLELDDTIPESHASIALAAHIYSWDWARAESHYRRAIELNPRFSTGHHWYAIFLAETGRPQEATAEIQRALILDPVSLIIGADAGMVLYLARKYDQALNQCRATLDMDPNYFRARMWLGCAFEQSGRYENAIAEYRTARLLDDSPYVVEWMARAYALSGNIAEARTLAGELTELASRAYVDSYYLASVYAALGDNRQAILLLERACVERSCWLSRLGVDPIFDSLRSEPGLERVLKALGFEPQNEPSS